MKHLFSAFFTLLSYGVLAQCGVNDAIFSEEFSNPHYSKTGIAIWSNVSSFNGIYNTADRMEATATTGSHRVSKATNTAWTASTTYTTSVYVKYENNPHVQLWSGSAFGSNIYANFNIQTGTVGAMAAGVTAGVVNAGNGWYRIWMTATTTATATTSNAGIALIPASTSGFIASWEATGTESVLLFGYQIEQCSIMSVYQPNTEEKVRPVDAPTGCVNLFTPTEDFSSAEYVLSNLTVIVNQSTFLAYQSADLLTDNATSGAHRWANSTSVTGGRYYVLSKYVKYVDHQFVQLSFGIGRFSSSQWANFDLLNGRLTAENNVTAGIQNAGNGWYRIWAIALSTSNGTADPAFAMVTAGDAARNQSYIGTGTSVLVFGSNFMECTDLVAYQANPQEIVGTPTPVTPEAPTSGVVDDTNNTFNWTNNPSFPAESDYEFTINGGTTVQSVTTKPINIGDVYLGVGQVGVRVKAIGGNPVSAWLFNTIAFVGSQTNTQITYQTPNSSRTELRDDAGLSGDAGAKSGFFEAVAPVNYPTVATGSWHLLDVRNSTPTSNFAMQFSGSFNDQELFFRKTNGNGLAPWKRIVTGGYGTLGNSVGNSLELISVNANTGNEAYFKVLLQRHSVGSGWENASTRLQAMTDVSYQGYIDFNPKGVPNGLAFGVSNNEYLRIMENGNIGIGTSNTHNYKLAVTGSAIFTRVVVKQHSAWPDYVFDASYKLPTLQEVEQFIKQYKHLPGVPSAKEVEVNNLDLGANQSVLLQKIEELTLYVIAHQKEIVELKEENAKLKEQSLLLKQIQQQIMELQKTSK